MTGGGRPLHVAGVLLGRTRTRLADGWNAAARRGRLARAPAAAAEA